MGPSATPGTEGQMNIFTSMSASLSFVPVPDRLHRNVKSPVCDSAYRVLGRLEEGEEAIIMYGFLEFTDTGRRIPCCALLDCGATGLFANSKFAEEIDTSLHRLESPVTIQNIDRTEN
jgi:hypothetical protein